ncbi:HAD family hydrolase [Sciscionella sediminilitoris]|uniref:HAD family hydrolase n=1 Tax=Sciscionella sediminilitoris TaxID=1445613 RepID=UPI0004DF170E|nr:HAD family hydrolase [Sciscionella sp. SE31]
MPSPQDPRLILWDIDHTLIESRGFGRMIYEQAFPQVTGRTLRDLAVVHGRTELDIMHDTLAAHDIEPTEATVHRLAEALAAGYRDRMAEFAERGRVLPGAREALATFAEQPNLHQSVLTGNTTEVARLKLRTFDLDRWLDLAVGAYGDDHRDRARLVTIATERAAIKFGAPIAPEQVTLIGDTPNDVHAAHAAGAHVIAVATGHYTVDDLTAAGATTAIPNLEALESTL